MYTKDRSHDPHARIRRWLIRAPDSELGQRRESWGCELRAATFGRHFLLQFSENVHGGVIDASFFSSLDRRSLFIRSRKKGVV